MVIHLGVPLSQEQPSQLVYFQNIATSTRTQEEKEDMKELIKHLKKLSTEVTHLRNQNNQIKNMQRNSQGYQGNYQNYHVQPSNQAYQSNTQGYQSNNQGYQTRTWNIGPNNGNVSSPLENPTTWENQPIENILLIELALSGWCWLHNTN